jgi:hypothetical protein
MRRKPIANAGPGRSTQTDVQIAARFGIETRAYLIHIVADSRACVPGRPQHAA